MNNASNKIAYFFKSKSLQQYNAMECIRNFVNESYQRLILNEQPNLNILLNMESMTLKGTNAPKEIMNGPVMSHKISESEVMLSLALDFNFSFVNLFFDVLKGFNATIQYD